MGLLPTSPRRRRRVIVLGSAAGAALLITGIFTLLPSTHPPDPTPSGKEGKAQLVAKTSRHVAPADRKLIDKAFDAFIPNALNRKNPEVAWAYAGPSLRVDSSLAQWRKGTMAVPEFPAVYTTYHGWRVLDATPTQVEYSVLVNPRKGHGASQWVFQGALVKLHGRWLVDTIYTTAIMAKPHNGFQEVGPKDFAAGASSKAEPSTHAVLSRTWLTTLIGVLVGFLVLVPLGIGIGILVRRRRWRRQAAAEGRTRELPALRKSDERDRTPVA
ncbi:MAG TPA: hypothetical protein VGU02_06470 [Gaiellaceae bacterium]|nr:hypothetical protein [Gaiellaceae bacterium]